jgi:hypothetical protein
MNLNPIRYETARDAANSESGVPTRKLNVQEAAQFLGLSVARSIEQRGTYKLEASRARRRLALTWNRWYAFKSYLRSSLWIVPFVALLLEQVTFRLGG